MPSWRASRGGEVQFADWREEEGGEAGDEAEQEQRYTRCPCSSKRIRDVLRVTLKNISYKLLMAVRLIEK